MIEDEGYDDDVTDEDEDEDGLSEPGDDADFVSDDVFGDEDDEDGEAGLIDSAPVRARRRAGPRGPSVAGIPKAKLEKAEFAEEAWRKLNDERHDVTAIPYTVRTKLNKEDVILHSRFGRGFVIDSAGPGKVEVLFQDTLRKLVHDR